MKQQKMAMRLERDADGYPPVDFERLWIAMLGEDTATVDNIPFFSREVALGDIVKVERTGDEYRYLATLRRSGNSLIRIVYYPPTNPVNLRAQIERLGCQTELDATHKLVAVSVPPGDCLKRLQELLQTGESKGELGYEEAILVSDPSAPTAVD